MKKLFNGVSHKFSHFYDGIIPSDKLAHKLWEEYEVMYQLDTTK